MRLSSLSAWWNSLEVISSVNFIFRFVVALLALIGVFMAWRENELRKRQQSKERKESSEVVAEQKARIRHLQEETMRLQSSFDNNRYDD
jgi:energy-converting hydrogenase Eha subunit F